VDISPGAHDDGGGVLSAWEAVRLMHELGLRPRRTVGWCCGSTRKTVARAKNYAERHRQELPKHVLAIESDRGAFQPTGFTFKGGEQATAIIGQVGALLEGIKADKMPRRRRRRCGATRAGGCAPHGVDVEGSKYFWFHHTAADTGQGESERTQPMRRGDGRDGLRSCRPAGEFASLTGPYCQDRRIDNTAQPLSLPCP